MDLTKFNRAELGQIRTLLGECLAAPRWVNAILDGRPYPSTDALLAAAELTLRPQEIHDGIASHPRIGERSEGDSSSAKWSCSEQSGMDPSSAELFKQANIEYEQRFGHVYLVCASGKSGPELLADLKIRLENDPDTELSVAGRELLKIAVLRLKKAVLA